MFDKLKEIRYFWFGKKKLKKVQRIKVSFTKEQITAMNIFTLEPRSWIKVVTAFIVRHSNMRNDQIIREIYKCIKWTPTTLADIFSLLLLFVEENNDYDIGFHTFKYIRALSSVGISGAESGKQLRETIAKLNNSGENDV